MFFEDHLFITLSPLDVPVFVDSVTLPSLLCPPSAIAISCGKRVVEHLLRLTLHFLYPFSFLVAT